MVGRDSYTYMYFHGSLLWPFYIARIYYEVSIANTQSFNNCTNFVRTFEFNVNVKIIDKKVYFFCKLLT